MRFLFATFLSALLIVSHSASARKAQQVEDMTLFQFGQLIAEELDYAIIFSPRVRKNKKVGLVLSDSIEPEALYNMFLSVLNMQGYAAVKTNNVIRIVREYKARTITPYH